MLLSTLSSGKWRRSFFCRPILNPHRRNDDYLHNAKIPIDTQIIEDLLTSPAAGN